MNTQGLYALSALGIAFVSSPAASMDTVPVDAAKHIVPVTVAAPAARGREDARRQTPPVAANVQGAGDRLPPSTLDQEIGTASDGGYHYYESGRR